MEKAVAKAEKEDIQRWTTKRKAALVLSILKGETSTQAAARQHGITVAELEDWKERFMLAAENALRARPRDEEALREEQIKKLLAESNYPVAALFIFSALMMSAALRGI